MTRVLVRLLSCFLMLPILFAFFILERLVASELGMLQFIFQQGCLMDLPSGLESINRTDDIIIDRLTTLNGLSFHHDSLRLHNAKMSVPVGAFFIESLMQIEKLSRVNKILAEPGQLYFKKPFPNGTLELDYLILLQVIAFGYGLLYSLLLLSLIPEAFAEEILDFDYRDRATYSLKYGQPRRLLFSEHSLRRE